MLKLSDIKAVVMLHVSEIPGAGKLKGTCNNAIVFISGRHYEKGSLRFIRFRSTGFDANLKVYTGIAEFEAVPVTKKVSTGVADADLGEVDDLVGEETELANAVDSDVCQLSDFTLLTNAMVGSN